MIWNDLQLESVITRNLFYFDESKKDICERICKKLEIDCFPDLSKNKFWIFEDGVWKSNEINYPLTDIYNPFDKKLLDLYKSNHSNIVFVSSNSMIDGIIHFTNYENEYVFSNLYTNLHVFEKNLRSFLLLLIDVNINTLKDYYTHKINNYDNDYYKNKLNDLGNLVNVKKPLHELYLQDLLEFSVSRFHKTEILKKLDLKKHNKGKNFESMRLLRNTIMHHKDEQITGENSNFLHDFMSFKNFFSQVILFKGIFDTLSNSISQYNLDKKIRLNSQKLAIFEQMNDIEIREYFYTNY
jgi:hypothetical protein